MERITNRWNDDVARSLSPLEQLVYRSNLLGADRAVVNWKGGNTSSKLLGVDVAGRPITVLWVKGSGSDLLTIKEDGFVPLRLEDLLLLEQRHAMSDEEMVDYLMRCVLKPGAPRPSIETLMHAFIPYPHVDHTHPDAVLAFCNTENGERLTKEAFGDRIAWVPYMRPGFDLANAVLRAVRGGGDRLRGVFLARHGLVTWGNTHKEAYLNALSVVNDAYAFIEARAGARPAFGGMAVSTLDLARCRRLLLNIMPVARGVMSERRRVILHYDDSPQVLEFVNSAAGKQLSQVGSACPDHLVHTKHLPLWVDFDPAADDETRLRERLVQGLREYKEKYRAYQAQYRRPGDPEGDPYPRIILIPGVGLLSTGKDKHEAQEAAGLYHRAIETMRGASALGRFVSLTPQQAYDIEYWPLELYKLTLAPPEKEFSRHVAVVAGAAGGIGRAVAELFAREGAYVAVTDIEELGLKIGAVNPNLFQDDDYKFGSLAHPEPRVRKKAVAHVLECIDIMRQVGSRDLSLWLPDGTDYPGQDDFVARKHRLEDSLSEIYHHLEPHMRLLIEYKLFEPAFYSTDVPDWGAALLHAQKLGPHVYVLVDLGHHAHGVNVEQIMAFLLDEGRLGGIHFNARKYADDDLTSGSINPYELFLIYNELVAAEERAGEPPDVAFVIDQSHNTKPTVEATIQSVLTLQEAYARALLVNRARLQEVQEACDVVAAETELLKAFQTRRDPVAGRS